MGCILETNWHSKEFKNSNNLKGVAVAVFDMLSASTGMDDIYYSRIHVIYVLRPCAVGFALHNIRDIFFRKWLLVVFNISVACHNFKTVAQNYQ